MLPPSAGLPLNIHNSYFDNRSNANSNNSNPSDAIVQRFLLAVSPALSQYQPSPSLSIQQLLSTHAAMDLQLSPTTSHSDTAPTQLNKPNELADVTSSRLDPESSNNNNTSLLDSSLNASTMHISDSRDTRPHALEFFSPLDNHESLGRSNSPPRSNYTSTFSRAPGHTLQGGGSVINRNRNQNRNRKLKKMASSMAASP